MRIPSFFKGDSDVAKVGRRREIETVVSIALMAFFILLLAVGIQVGAIDKADLKYYALPIVPVALYAFFVLTMLQESMFRHMVNRKIEAVEQRAIDHPDEPKYAWDVARTKLESYLDRNLSQVTSIYVLTVVVMLCGFFIVIYGLNKSFENPQSLGVAIVASASGVIISFLGGSFLIVYRSILAQARDYVAVLERINAVGMAVNVISSIPDEQSEVKTEATSRLARQLLNLYASPGITKVDDEESIR